MRLNWLIRVQRFIVLLKVICFVLFGLACNTFSPDDPFSFGDFPGRLSWNDIANVLSDGWCALLLVDLIDPLQCLATISACSGPHRNELAVLDLCLKIWI